MGRGSDHITDQRDNGPQKQEQEKTFRNKNQHTSSSLLSSSCHFLDQSILPHSAARTATTSDSISITCLHLLRILVLYETIMHLQILLYTCDTAPSIYHRYTTGTGKPGSTWSTFSASFAIKLIRLRTSLVKHAAVFPTTWYLV